MIEIVLSFARDYINDKKERTYDRKQKIRTVYKELIGEDINGRCSTCYIEALLKIMKLFEFKKITEMATPNYELKRGAILESFGHPEKFCTNDTITDELAEWHLRQCPEKAVLFARVAPKFITTVTAPPLIPSPPAPSRQNFQGAGRILAPETIILPPSKIAQEDPVKRKLLIDRVLELGFKSAPESPIELITSDELNVIISNLEKEKAKKDAELLAEQKVKTAENKPVKKTVKKLNTKK
jgi:hypothetical protein